MEEQVKWNKVLVIIGFVCLGLGIVMMAYFLINYSQQDENEGNENFFYALYSFLTGLAIFGIIELIIHWLFRLEMRKMNAADTIRETIEEQLNELREKNRDSVE